MKTLTLIAGLGLATGLSLFALDPPTPQWNFSTGGPIRSAPLVAGDRIYLTSGDGFTYALDKKGVPVWKTALKGGASFASPSLSQAGLAVVSGGSVLQLLDPQNGTVLWTRETGPNVTYDTWDYFHSTPLSRPDRIVFGSGDGFLYSVDPATGSVQWKTPTQPGENAALAAPVHSSPIWVGGLIYVASAFGYLFAIDPATGAKIDTIRLGDRVDGTPAIDGGQLFIGSRNTRFFAVGTGPFRQQWKFQVPGGSWMTSSPLVQGDLIVSGSSDARLVFAWNRHTGEVVWKTPVGGNVFSRLVETQGLILVSSGNAEAAGYGKLWALHSNDGSVAWSLPLADNSWATPAVDGGSIYVGDETGVLHAFE